MLVARGAADLPPSTGPDAVITAHLSMLRTSFNRKITPKLHPQGMAQSVWGYGVSLHQALWVSLRAGRKEPRNRQIFSRCITADISPCSYKTTPCRIPQPWLQGFCDLHIPGILMILVLWDLLQPCQKVTDKPRALQHRSRISAHWHCTWPWSQGPPLPLPSTLSLLLLWLTRSMWFQALQVREERQVSQAHSSSSAPGQFLQDNLHPTAQTSSHLYSLLILSSSSQSLALPWTNKKLRKIITLKCHQHSRESPFEYFYWPVWRQQKRHRKNSWPASCYQTLLKMTKGERAALFWNAKVLNRC